LQMTRTTPLRRTILQLRQIFFTDARTFMISTPNVLWWRVQRSKPPPPFRLAFFIKPSY
jgi:hypothetical protein